jgi:Protein of unknown function (DUF3570)
MQLDDRERPPSVRGRLKAAACMLLATGASRLAQAADPPQSPTDQIDVTTLVYSERITVVEPTVRFTRLYPDGHSFHGDFILDSITGASPSGALPSGQTQTVTSASGTVTTHSAGELPTTSFKDTRYAVAGEWLKPLKSSTWSVGGHFSREKDYQSLGATGKLSFDFNQKLTTLTLGAGYDQDEVFPVGGTTAGLSPPTVMTGSASNPKHLTSALVGMSQVLTRRWLLGVSAGITSEQGYLTEPYKVLSVIDGVTGMPVENLTEERPSSRSRLNLNADSVYHFTENIFYCTYRYYWDDWSVRSNTIDLRLRHPITEDAWFEPHLRYYAQSAADFYTFGLIQGQPLPDFASADYRLGRLDTVTGGFTVAFRPRGFAGEWTVRAEYMAQTGDSHPSGAVGVQQQYDLVPNLNIFTFVLGYNITY